MIRSMTGFGTARRESRRGLLDVEIRTENHRHFHTHFRLPPQAERLEPELTRLLREQLSRGHVRLRLDYEAGPAAARALEVDHDRMRAYSQAYDEIERTYVLPRLGVVRRALRHLLGGVDRRALLAFGDFLKAPGGEAEDIDREDAMAATREALAKVASTREREGETLQSDLESALGALQAALEVVLERAPQRLDEERERLRAAIQELSGDVTLDEERVAREIAFLAERWDINEEIVRLRSHASEFRGLLEADGSEPAGKRLGFWVQEMLREANTIGSKANDAEIARQVIEMKTAIEQIREQVENVE